VDSRTDIELVEAALVQPDAFGELVRRHQAFVFGAALRVTRDASLAEEVAQETFFRAYRSLKKFRGESKLRTWLYRIATNLAIDLVGRRRDTPVADVPETPTARSTSQIVELKLQSAELRDALAELPETLREPLILRAYQGLTYEEISEKSAIPLNTVRTRIFRGKAALREQLSDWEERP
jgi:RNA polymerase sigma-70 factor (ECF subfamily)